MPKMVQSILFGMLSLLLTGSSVFAQTGDLNLYSNAHLEAQHSNNFYGTIISSKAWLKVQPKYPSGNFTPTAGSENCSYPYLSVCRGIRIQFKSTDNTVPNDYARLIVVNATEIKFISPNLPKDTNYDIAVQVGERDGWTTTHQMVSQQGRRNLVIPFATTCGCDVTPPFHGLRHNGSLFGWNSTVIPPAPEYLQSIDYDFNLMPKTFDGSPTFIQVYYTGINSNDWNTQNLFGLQAAWTLGYAYPIVFDANPENGVYVLNVGEPGEPNGFNGWGTGIKYVYVGVVVNIGFWYIDQTLPWVRYRFY